MQCCKMQGATKAATVLDLSTSHFPEALQVNGSASPVQILHISGESSIKESREEDRRKTTSWIQRLKARDVLELSKGGSAEASLDAYHEKGNSCERRCSRTGILMQEIAANGLKAMPNCQIERVPDAETQKVSEPKDSNGVGKQRSDICLEQMSKIEQGKSMSSAMALPANPGFGPWVNFRSGRKPEVKPDSVSACKVDVGTATASTQESSMEVPGNFWSMFSLTNTIPRYSPVSVVGDVTDPAIVCKSTASPVHNKPGLPPKPPNQKSPGFHPPSKLAPLSSWMVRGGFHQFAQDGELNRQVFETASNRESKPLFSVQGKAKREISETAVRMSESFCQRTNPSERSFSDSIRGHGNGFPECGQELSARMGNTNPPVEQAKPSMVERAGACIAVGQTPAGCSHGAVVEFENGRTGVCKDLQLNASGEGGRGSICPNLPSDDMDLQSKVSMPRVKNPKSDLKNGFTNMEPNKMSVQQSCSGSSYGASKCEKADAIAPTSASLPWEMFINSAGTSRKAREEFLEVYNRARDELKNQRMSQRMNRAVSKEINTGPNLTLGSGDIVLKGEKHLGEHPQAQGRLDVLSRDPERRILSLASNSKEQHSSSLIESKGPNTTLVNEQSGLRRDSSIPLKLDTPWNQTDNVRVEQSLPEGHERLSDKMNVKASDQQIVGQRLDERSVVHIKEVSAADKGQICSSNMATSTREVASKIQEGTGLGQTTGLLHQLDDRKKGPSVLGKRSHVTFQEHSISRVLEKGSVSQSRPRSRPHVWLQRWHSTAAYNSTVEVLPGTQLPPADAKNSEPMSYLAFGLKKFKDGDGVGFFGRYKESKNVSCGNEKGMKMLNTNPSKMLPSAAAMAIVGTAARRFCSAQPQRKGSFAFWSGFGRPPPGKIEPVQEKGKA